MMVDILIECSDNSSYNKCILVVVEISTKSYNHVIINVISYLDLMVRMSLKDTIQCLVIHDMLHRMMLFYLPGVIYGVLSPSYSVPLILNVTDIANT